MTIYKKIKSVVASGVLATTIAIGGCAETRPFGNLRAYHDARWNSDATLIAGASNLPLGAKLFTTTDVKMDGDSIGDPYNETRLSKRGSYGFGAAIEYNRDFGKPKGATRLGAIYEPDLSKILDNTKIGLKFFPVSTQNKGIQLGLYGIKEFGDNRIDGFLDYNFDPKKIVTEIQYGRKISENLYGIVEGRYNGLAKTDRSGIGIGLQWDF